MRLAWFTPWPPQPTGVAGRSEDVTRELARRDHAIDVFVDAGEILIANRWPDTPPAAGEVRVQSAHDFIWRHGRDPYDLVVYQIGNSSLHEFIWPYLFRWPGLVMLHDARLHHARGRALLRRGNRKAYRAEFRFNHPDAGEGAEIGVRGFAGVYYYQWPMVRAVVESARLVATHARGTQLQLAETFPGRTIVHIALGMGRQEPTSETQRAAVREAWGLGPDAVVFGIFGGLTEEKRIDVILRAFAAARARVPQARLVLGGAPSAGLDLDAEISSLNLGDVVRRLPTLDDRSFEDSIAAVDVSLNMRWPTALEMSGPWVQALAAGRPTVIADLAHLTEIPTLDPRTWRRPGPGSHSIDADAEAIAVAVDLLDEEHSLRLAIERLGESAALRARLGAAARRYWEREHTLEKMTDDYQRAISRAAAFSAPDVTLPSHLRPDAVAFARSLAEPFGAEAVAAIEELKR
ncbi:MAG TPA: glycosyltransferase [Vicinamibacterales bacterium]|nr:glycosyltransferase [Vicinamibacterales bacterium]